jgi:thiamine biosynthesis lipoprotein
MTLEYLKKMYPLTTLEANSSLRKKAALAAFFCLFLLVWSCRAPEDALYFEGEAQATTFHITVYGDAHVEAIDIQRWLAEYNHVASPWDSTSLITALNGPALVAPDHPYLCELLQIGQALYLETDGALDPTLAPVIEAWGFGVGPATILPGDTLALEALMEHVGDTSWFSLAKTCTGQSPIKLALDKGPRVPGREGVRTQLNFMSFSQGHSVDIVCDSLRARGATAAFVEIGGEVRTFGVKPDGSAYKVGIELPQAGKSSDYAQTVELDARALATSGNYRNYKVDPATGAHYGHTLDAKTGWPIQTEVLSATMIGPTCAEADGMATAAMSMGLEKTKQWLAQHPEWDGLLIYFNGNVGDGHQVWASWDLTE